MVVSVVVVAAVVAPRIDLPIGEPVNLVARREVVDTKMQSSPPKRI